MPKESAPRNTYLREVAEELFANLHLVSTTQTHKGPNSTELVVMNPHDITTSIFTAGIQVVEKGKEEPSNLRPFLDELNEWNGETDRLDDRDLQHVSFVMSALWRELKQRQKDLERARDDWGDSYRQLGAQMADSLGPNARAVHEPVESDQLPGLEYITFQDGDGEPINVHEFIETMFYFDAEQRLSSDPVLKRWQLEDAYIGFIRPLLSATPTREAE